MENQRTNIFIVDDNKLMVIALKQYLQNKFETLVNITTFSDGESCLKMLDKDIHIVILDYFMEGKNGLEVLKSIKATNPKTEVIMLSNNEDIALAVDSFRAGAKDYVVKGTGSWERVTKLLKHTITEPIRFIVKGFSRSK
ncbi:MAG: response regulator [Bacteroidia bacterium]